MLFFKIIKKIYYLTFFYFVYYFSSFLHTDIILITLIKILFTYLFFTNIYTHDDFY